LQRYLEAVEGVMQPVRLLVEPVHQPKVWDEIRYSYCSHIHRFHFSVAVDIQFVSFYTASWLLVFNM